MMQEMNKIQRAMHHIHSQATIDKQTSISFQAFLELMSQRPSAVIRNVFQFFHDMVKAYVGEGDAKWMDIFAVLEAQKATEWYIVEYEIEGMPAMESVSRCLENLRKMGK